MIGFKSIDEFSFDDCVSSIERHESEGTPIDADLQARYNQLLSSLQKEDESAFNKCFTLQDFQNYLNRFKNLSGVNKYQPLHEAETIQRINQFKKLHEEELKNNKKYNVLGLIFGLILGILSQRYLPYIVASLINGDSADWGILGFPISYGVLFLIFKILRVLKKNILYNRFIALLGGMVISCVPMFFYLEHNEVSYDWFSDYGTFYGGEKGRVGIANSFGNSIIPRKYDCFYETANDIIGVVDNSGSIKIDWYTKEDFQLFNSENYWIVEDDSTSKSLKEVIESNNAVITDSWRYNNIHVVTRNGKELLWPVNPVHNSWRDPEILDLRVIEQ